MTCTPSHPKAHSLELHAPSPNQDYQDLQSSTKHEVNEEQEFKSSQSSLEFPHSISSLLAAVLFGLKFPLLFFFSTLNIMMQVQEEEEEDNSRWSFNIILKLDSRRCHFLFYKWLCKRCRFII